MKWIPEPRRLMLACALGVMSVSVVFPISALGANRVVLCEEFTATW
jgi:hypothetical protein